MITTATDANARQAARGAALTIEYRHLIQRVDTGTDRLARARRGLALARLDWALGSSDPADTLAERRAVITDAVIDVLHHADGWHYAPVALNYAFGLCDQPGTPLPDPSADPHALPLLASIIADLFTAAATHYAQEIETTADDAETAFQDEVDTARFDSIRAARS